MFINIYLIFFEASTRVAALEAYHAKFSIQTTEARFKKTKYY